MRFRKSIAFAGVSLLVLSACNATPGASGGAGGGSKGTVFIGIELPQQGSELAASGPIINGIKLAVKDAGGVAGNYKIEVPK